MRVLVDTHSLLWFYLTDSKLSLFARQLLEDESITKFVSPASLWELAIKISIGKYQLHESFDSFVQQAIFDNGFLILPIEPRRTTLISSMSFQHHHKDPFDRMLVAQSSVEEIPLVSADAIFDTYGVRRLW